MLQKSLNQGGSIIMAAKCCEGFPDHGTLNKDCFRKKNMKIYLNGSIHPTQQRPEEWQVIILLKF